MSKHAFTLENGVKNPRMTVVRFPRRPVEKAIIKRVQKIVPLAALRVDHVVTF